MTISIRTILNNSNGKRIVTDAIIVRRLNNKVKGLGYWAARDYAKQHQPSLLIT